MLDFKFLRPAFAIALVSVLAGCEARPLPVPARPVANVKRQLTPVDSSSFQFPTEELRATMERWQTAAAGMRQEDWSHQDWFKEPQTLYGAATWWSTVPGRADLSVHFDRSGAQEALLQSVKLGIYGNGALDKVEGVTLLATWYPHGKWGASFYIGARENGNSTQLTFMPRGFNEKHLSFWPDLTRWQSERTVNGTKYRFHLASDPEDQRDGGGAGNISLERLVAWYESPEALRDGGFQLLDKLEAAAREAIPAGKGSKTYVTKKEGGDRSDNPPRYFDQPVEVPLHDAVMADALKDCVADIAARRALLEKHYQEMHTALVNVFPKEAILP